MLLISSSSTQKAAARAAGIGRSVAYLYVRFADESCSAQEKVSCLFASRMRALGTATRDGGGDRVSYICRSLQACDITRTVSVGHPSENPHRAMRTPIVSSHGSGREFRA